MIPETCSTGDFNKYSYKRKENKEAKRKEGGREGRQAERQASSGHFQSQIHLGNTGLNKISIFTEMLPPFIQLADHQSL